MEAVARLKNCKGSPRKIRPVANIIKGKRVEEALHTLKFSPRKASKDIEKLLMSAISNWENKNEGIRIEDVDLYVKQAYVDQGQALKRWRPAARGMAHMYKKHRSHITLVVDSKQEITKEDIEAEQEEAAETETKET